jgi:hypothetical protein
MLVGVSGPGGRKLKTQDATLLSSLAVVVLTKTAI